MKFRFLSALVCALFVVSACAHADDSGDFSTDRAQWQNDACGTIIDIGFDQIVDFSGNLLADLSDYNSTVPNGQALAWGNLSQVGSTPDGVIFRKDDQISYQEAFVRILVGRRLSINIDPANPAVGSLTGFCLRYGNAFQANVNIYEGTTLIDSCNTEVGQNDIVGGTPTYICWSNSTGANVTRIEIEPILDGSGGEEIALLEGEFSFGDCDANPTCFEQLGSVKDNVASFLDSTTNAEDAYWAEGALDCICWSQQDVFWEQPSGDRLSRYGGSFFIGAAYAVAYLECVDDPQADVLIDELMVVLECIVDAEIEYAIANGGRSCFIDRAEDLANLGEMIDDDFNNEIIATLVYRLAWLNAYYSTQ